MTKAFHVVLTDLRDIELIEKAIRNERRSASSFQRKAMVEYAKEVLKE